MPNPHVYLPYVVILSCVFCLIIPVFEPDQILLHAGRWNWHRRGTWSTLSPPSSAISSQVVRDRRRPPHALPLRTYIHADSRKSFITLRRPWFSYGAGATTGVHGPRRSSGSIRGAIRSALHGAWRRHSAAALLTRTDHTHTIGTWRNRGLLTRRPQLVFYTPRAQVRLGSVRGRVPGRRGYLRTNSRPRQASAPREHTQRTAEAGAGRVRPHTYSLTCV